MDGLPLRLLRPATLEDALRQRAEIPGARWLAGGTDLLVNLRRGLGTPPALIDLSGIPALQVLEESGGGGLRIGAGVSLARLAADPALTTFFPVVATAAAAIAGPTHREAATVGGNLCQDTRCLHYNQSSWWRDADDYCLKHGAEVCRVAPTGRRCHAAYCGDLAPALMVLEAEVELAGPDGRCRLPLPDLYADDGRSWLTLAPDALVVAVLLPPPPAGLRADYAKARVRGAIDFPLAGVAAAITGPAGRPDRVRIALTGTNARPLLLDGTAFSDGRPLDDDALAALEKAVQRQVQPMRTAFSPAHYRRRVAAALARRMVRTLAAGPGT